MRLKTMKVIDKLVSHALKVNVNSTSSFIAYQPEMPKQLNSVLKNHD